MAVGKRKPTADSFSVPVDHSPAGCYNEGSNRFKRRI